MRERKMPSRGVAIMEWWFKYNDRADDPDNFTLTYEEVIEELESEAHHKNKTPEEEFLSIRTVFEMQLDRIEKTGEMRKKYLVDALTKIYKELD